MYWGHSINNGVRCALHRFWLYLEWSWDLRKKAQESVNEGWWNSEDHEGKFALILWRRNNTPLCWLAWMKPVTCKCYLRESVRVCPSSWHSFPWFNLGKSTEGLPPFGHTGWCLLAFIKEILLPVSGWFWERWDRCLLDGMGCPKGGRAGGGWGIFKIKSHGKCVFTQTSVGPSIPSTYHVRGNQDTKVNIIGPGSWRPLNKSLLNQWFKFML